jgi:hypothetical protein
VGVEGEGAECCVEVEEVRGAVMPRAMVLRSEMARRAAFRCWTRARMAVEEFWSGKWASSDS